MPALTLRDIQSVATKIRENVGKVIVGKGDVVDLALIARAAVVGLPCRVAKRRTSSCRA